MLKRIILNNYKAFAGETVIELRPITVLYGKNSSGKSSLCKFVSVLSKAFSASTQSLLPLRNGEVVLGGRLEDLFHDNVLSGFRIRAEFDKDIQVDTEFLMNEGKLYVRNYCLSKGGTKLQIAYKSITESEADTYKGLVNPRFFRSLGVSEEELKFTVGYIGPIRSAAKRAVFSYDIAGIEGVGYNGENTPYILLDSHLNGGMLMKQVSDWYKENMEGQWLEIVENGLGTGSYSFVMHRGRACVNLADVGEGHNQLLPIVTQAFANKSDITVIEQPALHLHPSAHANIAYLLANAAKRDEKMFLIESHSENFLLGLRKMVAEKNMNPEDVIVYYINHDENEAYAQPIEIETNGDLTYWPEGVFEEDFELLRDISKAER